MIMNVRKNKLYRVKTCIATSTLLLASGLVATSCVDNSFDLDEDIDMTMGLGADGLSMNLGNTDTVFLDDILDIDKNVKLDESNVYYLVAEDSTKVEFNVDKVSTWINNASLAADEPIIDFSKIIPEGDPSMTVTPSNWTVPDKRATGSTDDFTFTVKNITSQVKHLDSVYPVAGTKVRLLLHLNVPSNVNLELEEITDLKIKMPDYLGIKEVSRGTVNGQVITIPSLENLGNGELCKIDVASITLGENGAISGRNELTLPPEKSRITLSGKFKLTPKGSFTVNRDDKVTMSMDIVLGNGQVGHSSEMFFDKVVGKFDPVIDPSIESINIQKQLPDFLQDEEVRVVVANPTLRFDVDMTQIPASLNFMGQLTAHKGGANAFDKTISLPESGSVEFIKSKKNCVYFCQQSDPYDPTGVVADATKSTVSNLGKLIEQLPEYVKVDVRDNKIKLKDEMVTIELGKDYKSSLGYKIFVPFQFNEGLKIVYRDSTNSLNDDLKDYQAEGLAIKVKAYSTVPLDLNGSIYPVDVNGNEISSIQVDPLTIKGSSDGTTEEATEMEVSVKLTNPKDLQKVDRFLFRVSADAIQSGLSLNSKQYLRFENVRLKLKGQIIADFN